MAELTQIELQNLKHLINLHDTEYNKLLSYSKQCVDPQIKQIFKQSAQDSLNIKQKLLTFLD